MKDNLFKVRNYIIPTIIILIGAAYVVLTSLVEYRGDDLGYATGLSDYISNSGHGAWRYPFSHILNVNARMGDTFNFIFLDWLPRPLLNILCGVAVGAFYWLVLRLAFRQKKTGVTARLTVITLLTFTFQWWDLFLMLVVQINYIWAVVLNLFCIFLILKKDLSAKAVIGLIPLFLISPAMHEACGLPISAAAILYILLRDRSLGILTESPRRALYISYGIGTFIPFLSPAFYRRLFSTVSDAVPDDSILTIFLKSDYYIILLFVILMVILLSDSKKLKAILTSHTSFWIIAAVISAMISSVSGVVGRSGWFAQTFALIASVQILCNYDWKIKRDSGCFLSAIMIFSILFHYGALIYWQNIYYNFTRKVLTEYRKNPSSPVYTDYISFSDAPEWLLGKPLGMFDASDWYCLEVERRANDIDEKYPLVILPSQMKEIDLTKAHLPYLGIGCAIYPNDTDMKEPEIEILKSGEQMSKIPFEINGRKLVLYRLRDMRPGDR